MSGYVYLIGNSRFHWFKIGKSKTPEIRISDLGILLPFKIKIFGIWKAINHSLAESALHEQHAAQRINGEWFSFSDKKVAEFYRSIPTEACIFWHDYNKDSKFAKFSNIAEDITSLKPKNRMMDVIMIAERPINRNAS